MRPDNFLKISSQIKTLLNQFSFFFVKFRSTCSTEELIEIILGISEDLENL